MDGSSSRALATMTGGAAHGAQHGEHLGPVDVGQAEVEQHQVGLLVDRDLQPDHARGALDAAYPRSVSERTSRSGCAGRPRSPARVSHWER